MNLRVADSAFDRPGTLPGSSDNPRGSFFLTTRSGVVHRGGVVLPAELLPHHLLLRVLVACPRGAGAIYGSHGFRPRRPASTLRELHPALSPLRQLALLRPPGSRLGCLRAPIRLP